MLDGMATNVSMAFGESNWARADEQNSSRIAMAKSSAESQKKMEVILLVSMFQKSFVHSPGSLTSILIRSSHLTSHS